MDHREARRRQRRRHEDARGDQQRDPARRGAVVQRSTTWASSVRAGRGRTSRRTWRPRRASTRRQFPASAPSTRASTAARARCPSSRTRTGSTTTPTCSRGQHHRASEDDVGVGRDREETHEFNDDGSIKVAGFVPVHGCNCEANVVRIRPRCSAPTWYNDDGTEAGVNTRPRVAGHGELAEGARRLLRRRRPADGSSTGQGSMGGRRVLGEQDFQTGRVAMTIDGEWRTSENFMGRPAPVPNMTRRRSRCPTTRPTCTAWVRSAAPIIGIPKGSPHRRKRGC